MIVIPPPEYLNAVNGGRSKNTGPTLDGSRPSRMSTSVGRGCEGW